MLVLDGLMTRCSLAQTTIDTAEGARHLADEAVRRRLAACVQLEGPITSIYHWKGSIESASEWRLTFKTASDRLPELAAWLREAHPYEIPEWIVWNLETSPTYGAWIHDNTAKPITD